MNEFHQKILAAHVIATDAMAKAKADWRASLSPESLAHADKHFCGEPAYCGFAWVIVPKQYNPDFAKQAKAAYAEAGYKLVGGNVCTLDGEFARNTPASIRDLGSPAGYAKKGQCVAADWQFHGPGEYRGQSMEIKEVGANAFAKALVDMGLATNVRVFTRGD